MDIRKDIAVWIQGYGDAWIQGFSFMDTRMHRCMA